MSATCLRNPASLSRHPRSATITSFTSYSLEPPPTSKVSLLLFAPLHASVYVVSFNGCFIFFFSLCAFSTVLESHAFFFHRDQTDPFFLLKFSYSPVLYYFFFFTFFTRNAAAGWWTARLWVRQELEPRHPWRRRWRGLPAPSGTCFFHLSYYFEHVFWFSWLCVNLRNARIFTIPLYLTHNHKRNRWM